MDFYSAAVDNVHIEFRRLHDPSQKPISLMLSKRMTAKEFIETIAKTINIKPQRIRLTKYNK